MRSNDAVFGFCNDVFTFCLFQQLMLNELRPLYPEIQLGSYFHFSGSFHIYSRHWSMMNSIFEKYPNIEYKESNRRILKDKVTYRFMKDKNYILPPIDLSKDEMIKFSKRVEGEIFK